MEQLRRIESVEVKQVESAGSKDVGGEIAVDHYAAAVDHYAAAAAVPDSAVDESVLQVKQVEVEFVTVVTAPEDSDP